MKMVPIGVYSHAGAPVLSGFSYFISFNDGVLRHTVSSFVVSRDDIYSVLVAKHQQLGIGVPIMRSSVLGGIVHLEVFDCARQSMFQVL